MAATESAPHRRAQFLADVVPDDPAAGTLAESQRPVGRVGIRSDHDDPVRWLGIEGSKAAVREVNGVDDHELRLTSGDGIHEHLA